MSNRARFTVILAAASLLVGCAELYGPLENPADPSAANYQGFETVGSPDDIGSHTDDSLLFPRFVVTEVVDAEAYRLEIAESQVFDAATIVYEEEFESNIMPVVTDLAAGTTYYWRAAARVDGAWGSWTGKRSIQMQQLSGIAPSSGETTTDTTPEFRWGSAADAVSYQLQLAEAESAFSSVAAVDLSTTRYTPTTALTNDQTHHWRIRAIDESGLFSAWTSAALTVLWGSITGLRPADGDSVNDSTPKLAWEPVEAATHYELQIATTEQEVQNAETLQRVTPSYEYQTLISAGDSIYWRVRAEDSDGTRGPWTSVRQVEYMPPVLRTTPIANTVDASIDLVTSVYAIDLDSDDDTDILGATQTGSVAWWENDGSETFTKHTVTSGAYTIYATDVDGDGDTDMLGASPYTDEISWWENDGDESFEKQTVLSGFDGAIGIYSSDVDGDGDFDIVAGAHSESSGIVWMENDGTATFTKHVVDTSFSAFSVFATDVDNDGDTDIVGLDNGDSEVAWWENNGSEDFTKRVVEHGSWMGLTSVHATDVNGNGEIDILVAANNQDEIAWWENDGDEGFTKRVVDGSFDGAESVYATDLDGDGDTDIVGAAEYADDIAWWENDGTETFTKHIVEGSFNGAIAAYATDVDGDGVNDIVGAARLEDEITWWDIWE